MTGSITGSYIADGSVIVTSKERNKVTATATVLDKTMDGSGIFGEFLSMSPVNNAPMNALTPDRC